LSDPGEQKRRWILVARILRPRGNKGEVLAELLTDFPERFFASKQIYLSNGGGEPQPAALQHFWIDRNHPGMGVFHLAGCSSISEAEKLRGLDVMLPFEERVALPVGQYFVTDLIGCAVFPVPLDATAEAPQTLGTVSDVFFPGENLAGTPILQVQTPKGELLVPLAEDICTRIDVAARRIEVRLPEGLGELNERESPRE
jgi:16S rRNA processing protein RimM